jgi:hypothetical protein
LIDRTKAAESRQTNSYRETGLSEMPNELLGWVVVHIFTGTGANSPPLGIKPYAGTDSIRTQYDLSWRALEEKVSQKKNSLENHDETDEAFSGAHVVLDSRFDITIVGSI